MERKKIMKRIFSIVLLILTVFTLPVMAGELNPPPSAISNGTPVPTMKTLNEIPAKDEVIPPWSQILPAAERFKLVMGGAAVLDRETGLVWEQSPSPTLMSWNDAMDYCYRLILTNRKGWRIPTIDEMSSLLDPSVTGLPKLPSGHPFGRVQPVPYWSSTRGIEFGINDGQLAWVADFSNYFSDDMYKTYMYGAWCVRGGHSNGGN